LKKNTYHIIKKKIILVTVSNANNIDIPEALWTYPFSATIFFYSIAINSNATLHINVTSISGTCSITVNGINAPNGYLTINIHNIDTLIINSTSFDGSSTSTYTFSLNKITTPLSSNSCQMVSGTSIGSYCYVAYSFPNIQFTQAKAQQFCSNNKGNVPSVHSQNEQNTLASLLGNTGQAWLSQIYDQIWINDGTMVNFTNYYGMVGSNGCYSTTPTYWSYLPCEYSIYASVICKYSYHEGIIIIIIIISF